MRDDLELLRLLYAGEESPPNSAWEAVRSRVSAAIALEQPGVQPAPKHLHIPRRSPRATLPAAAAIALVVALAIAAGVLFSSTTQPKTQSVIGRTGIGTTSPPPTSSGSPSTTPRTRPPSSVPSSRAATTTITPSATKSTAPTSAGNGIILLASTKSATVGQAISVSGSGFHAHSVVKVQLDSKKTLVTTSANGNGDFKALVRIPSGTNAGSHQLVAVGTDTAGGTVEQSTALVVTADTTPPNIVGPTQPGALSLSTTEVNASSSNRTVQLTLRVQDAGSGFSTSNSDVTYSNGTTSVEGSWTLLSGNDNDGTYDYNLVFPEGTPAGIYNLEAINLVDNAGNKRSYNRTALQSLGYDLSGLAVTDETTPVNTPSSTSPPSIVVAGAPGALAVSTAEIDSTTGNQTVALTIRVQDAGSEFSPSSSDVTYSNGTNSIGGTWTLVSGNGNDGTYDYNLVFPQGTSPGVYNIESITLVDGAGNQQSYTRTDLQTLGYDLSSLAVTDDPGSDTAPPNIVAAGLPGALSVSTAEVDTDSANTTVLLTIRVQDAGAAFSPSSSSVTYSNGITDAGGSWTLVSGNGNDGTYDYNLLFPEGTSTGVYNIESITLVDDAGNEQSYTRTDLQSLGYDLSSLAITDS